MVIPVHPFWSSSHQKRMMEVSWHVPPLIYALEPIPRSPIHGSWTFFVSLLHPFLIIPFNFHSREILFRESFCIIIILLMYQGKKDSYFSVSKYFPSKVNLLYTLVNIGIFWCLIQFHTFTPNSSSFKKVYPFILFLLLGSLLTLLYTFWHKTVNNGHSFYYCRCHWPQESPATFLLLCLQLLLVFSCPLS